MLFIAHVATITEILQCIIWSDDECQQGSHLEPAMAIHGQIPSFDDIADDSINSPTPSQVAFRQVINTGKAFLPQF